MNILNCAAPTPREPSGSSVSQDECPPVQAAPGACVPLALGAKPKQSRQSKLHHLLTKVPTNSFSTSQSHQQNLLSNSPIPSALAAPYIQLSRRFLEDKKSSKSPGRLSLRRIAAIAAGSQRYPGLRGRFFWFPLSRRG